MVESKKELKIQKNIPLGPLTTLKVGGLARFFVEANSEDEVVDAVHWAKQNKQKLFVLGGGSNLLISDEGFDGLVLKISLKGITEDIVGGVHYITVQAGEDWDQFVARCVAKNLQGIECLSGIPGTVGGTPVQNVGAYGQEVSETITSVRVLDRQSGEIFEMPTSDCGFAYRTSIFNTTHRDKYIVLAVTFRLNPDGAPKIVYADLKNLFGDKQPTLSETRNAVVKIRAAKSMVIDPNDPNSRSAGSFFKNPIVTKEKFDEIVDIAKRMGVENVPSYPVDSLHVKIPAAWLIEKAGFQKGYRKGNAGISTNHTLALINLGNAKAEDILDLKAEIETKVIQVFGVSLMMEPILVDG